jgi:hypothetical protein
MRVRVIEIQESYIFIVNIDANTSMPKKELYTTLATEIEQKELVEIADPFTKVIANADLTDVQIQHFKVVSFVKLIV